MVISARISMGLLCVCARIMEKFRIYFQTMFFELCAKAGELYHIKQILYELSTVC